MNFGFENRNKGIAAIALVVVAVGVVVWELWPASNTSPQGTAAPVVHAAPIAAGKKAGLALSTLDPTLRFEWLKESEGVKYEGNGKNIFVAQVEPPLAPLGNGTTDHNQAPAPPPPDPGPPPPPPINLKFYGFATPHGEHTKVFLSRDDDIFIAGEGDIVDRRYKVIHIYPMAVEIEDVLNNNRQQIPLTQG